MSSVLEPIKAEASQRYFHLRDVQWADSGNGKDYTFEGKAAIFNSWSAPLWTPRGFFRERIRPGAFTQVLAGNPDVRLLKNHDKNLVLGRTKSGTLDLSEIEDSLKVWARIARTTYATDLKMSMERGDIDGMSFFFETDYEKGADDNWYIDEDSGEVRRDVLVVSDLIEVTIATFPAYADTEAVMREMRMREAQGDIIVPDRETITVRTTERVSPRAYARCRQLVSETPWAIKPSYLDMILGILSERMEGIKLSDEQIKERIGAQRDNEPTNEGPVAVIPLLGPIYSRAGAMQQVSAAKSLDMFREQFKAAVNDSAVKAILMDVDSPGGTADMVMEAAMDVRAARSQKPVVAIANGMAASAAYWIASAASEFVVTPSGEVGSIGVYAAHTDVSRKQEMSGEKTTLVKAGKYKAETSPYEPLTEEARAKLQDDVDAIYGMFTDAVARNRGTTKSDVIDNYGQGRTLMAKDALEAGMVDGIETYEQVLSRLQQAVGGNATVSDSKANNTGNTSFAQGGVVSISSGSSASSASSGSSIDNLIVTADGVAVLPKSDAKDEEKDQGEKEGTMLESRELARDYLGLSAAHEDVGLVSGADDPVEADSLAALKTASKEAMQRARDDKVRLTKEMLGKRKTTE